MSGEKPGLYYAISTDKGASFSPRQRLAAQQRIGKHAHTAVNAQGKLFVVWDHTVEKTFSVFGALDVRKGLLRKNSDHEGVAYPIVAVNDQVAVIAGMRTDLRQIVTYCERLNEPKPE